MKCESCKFYKGMCDPVSGKCIIFKPKNENEEKENSFNMDILFLLLLFLLVANEQDLKNITKAMKTIMEDKTDEEEKG